VAIPWTNILTTNGFRVPNLSTRLPGRRVREQPRKPVRTQDETDEKWGDSEHGTEIRQDREDNAATEADEKRTDDDRSQDEPPPSSAPEAACSRLKEPFLSPFSMSIPELRLQSSAIDCVVTIFPLGLYS